MIGLRLMSWHGGRSQRDSLRARALRSADDRTRAPPRVARHAAGGESGRKDFRGVSRFSASTALPVPPFRPIQT